LYEKFKGLNLSASAFSLPVPWNSRRVGIIPLGTGALYDVPLYPHKVVSLTPSKADLIIRNRDRKIFDKYPNLKDIVFKQTITFL
jgi:hypothetical protein